MNRRMIAIWISCLLGAVSNVQAQNYRYAVFSIPAGADGHSSAESIASDGTVLAWASGSRSRYFLWKNGNVEYLASSGGEAINDSHDVAGTTWTDGWMATLWRRDGQVIELGTLGGEESHAYDINNTGQIVGIADLPPGHEHAWHLFVWQNGVMTDIGRFGDWTLPEAINAYGTVVGNYLPELTRTTQPYFWQDGAFTALPPLDEDRTSLALDVNDDGVIVGMADQSIFSHAVKWVNGEIVDLHAQNTFVRHSSAAAINSQGVIVGGMNIAFGRGLEGFVTDEEGWMKSLNPLFPPQCRFEITYAHDLNDFGQIVGRDAERERGVILSPVTPTLNLTDPSPGVAGRVNRITVTDATPGERVVFLYGIYGGGKAIPGCDLRTRAAVQIEDPVVIGTAVVDQFGWASVSRFVPPIASGHELLFQAVQQNGCKVSQLVVRRFE